MKCRICGNENTSVLANELRRGQGTVYYCAHCDYGMLEPEFEDAEAYYDTEYRKKFKDVLTAPKESPQEIFDMRKNYQEDRVRIISEYFDRQKNFLEIGSSAGQFLYHIASQFQEVAGIELDKSCVEFCRTLLAEQGKEPKLYTHSIEDISWGPEELFDYIGFFQVLEHIVDPVRFLWEVKKRLEPDGRIFIEVPNLDDPLRKLWDVPAYEKFYYHEAHLSYFSEKSLKKILDKCGFELEEIFFLQDYNLLNNLYWYFNNAPQSTCEFGLDKPHIKFKSEKVGIELNRLFEQMNDEYFRILSENKLTANIFVVAKRKEN